jgi:large subunit ribosomal protein L21
MITIVGLEEAALAARGAASLMGETVVYAIVGIHGFQYRVAENERVRVPRLTGDVGASVAFDRILFLSDGERSRVGTPVVDGARVEAEIVAHGKGKKVIIGKYKRRKDYRRKNGHRQPYTEIRITRVGGDL